VIEPLITKPAAPQTPLQPATAPPSLIQRIDNETVGFDMPRPNLLRNGGFEEWPNGAGPFSQAGQEAARGWTLFANQYGDVPVIEQVPSTAPAGSVSALKLTGTTDNANLVAQDIDPESCALNGVTVSLSFLAYAPVGTQMNAAIGILGQIAYQLPQTVDGTGDWQAVRLTAMLPAGPPQTVTIVIGGYGLHDFVFDNVSLVIGAAPADYQPTAQDYARSFVSGSVDAPSISFTGDGDSGLYNPSSNTVAIAAGGTDSLLATPTGVTIPGNLDVAGTITNNGRPLEGIDKELRAYVQRIMSVLDPNGPPAPPP
jgi:hypothetical protein